MAAAKNPNKAPNVPEWSDPLPPPVLIDGFWHMEEGKTIEGVAIKYGETKYGPYLAIKVKNETEISRDGEYLTVPAGSIVGVTERAAMAGLREVIEKGEPTAVRIVCNGKDGRAWNLEVRHRPAF